PGLDQITVPSGRVPAYTVTSADALPAVIVTCPGATAVRTGGSAVDRLTTDGSLDVHGTPLTGCQAPAGALKVRVSAATRLNLLGMSVNGLPRGTKLAVTETGEVIVTFCGEIAPDSPPLNPLKT